jgi:hypothetical protein
VTLKKFQPVLSAPNCVGRTEYCPSDDVTALLAKPSTTRIETRRFAQYSANHGARCRCDGRWLAVGTGAPRLAATSYLFWTLVKCALERPLLATLACQCLKEVPEDLCCVIEELRLLEQGE